MVCVSASAKLLVVGWVLLMWIKEGNAQELTLGTLACPRSATANTGCYCTNGCAVQGDRPFPWQAPAFPPTPLDASYVGSDTICAKITFPITPDVASVNLATYLGVQGRQTASQAPFVATANYTEVTVWTALSASQCSNVVTLASAVVKAIPSASGLYVNFCTTNLCNGVNLPALPAPTTAATTTGVRFPGACPVANVEPTGCYCTVGCGVNGDPSFPWSAAKWPPVALGASVVGSDTICAKITFPIVNTAAGLDFAAYLGVTGDVLRTGSNYFGAAVGETVTVYTAFTTQECKNFVSLAKSLASTTAVNTGMVLCNTTNCNSITSGNPGSGAVSSARGGVVVGMLLCGILAFLVVGFA